MNRITNRSVRHIMLGALFILLTAGSTWAAPIAALTYTETDLGGGTFRYDYVLRSLADPTTDAGVDAFDFALFFSPSVTVLDAAVPSGWDAIVGSGFLDTFSLIPGVPPGGSDVGPGGRLGPFSFVFDGRIGRIPFEVLFTDPTDPDNPFVFEGTTRPEGKPSVPEPSSMLLGALTAAAIAIRRRVHASTARHS